MKGFISHKFDGLRLTIKLYIAKQIATRIQFQVQNLTTINSSIRVGYIYQERFPRKINTYLNNVTEIYFLMENQNNIIIDHCSKEIFLRIQQEKIMLEVAWFGVKQIFLKQFVKEILIMKRTEKQKKMLAYSSKQLIEKNAKKSLHDHYELNPMKIRKDCNEQGQNELKKNDKKKQQENRKRIGKKVKGAKQMTNFVVITGKNKKKINFHRFGMMGMLLPMDRTQAKIDFIQYAFHSSEEISIYLKNLKKSSSDEGGSSEQKGIKDFIKEYSCKERDAKICLCWYTKKSFFYKVINKGLRILDNPEESYYLRLPFSDLFFSIKERYEKQKSEEKFIEQFKNRQYISFYRGCKFSDAEIQQLKENIFGYIQLEGFISTTADKNIALQKFSEGVFLEIIVKLENLGGAIDNGFTNIEDVSEYDEKEVLFNAFNLFKVLKVDHIMKEYQGYDSSVPIQIWEIQLQYSTMKNIERKIQKSERLLVNEQQVIQHFNFQNKIQNKIKNKAVIFKELGMDKQRQKCFKQMMNIYQKRQAVWSSDFDSVESKREKHYLLYELGIIYYLKGKFENALQNFEECRDLCEFKMFGELSDQQAETFYQLGWCYENLNRQNQSIECFQRTQQILHMVGKKKNFLYRKTCLKLERDDEKNCELEKENLMELEKQGKDETKQYLRHIRNIMIHLEAFDKWEEVKNYYEEGLRIIERNVQFEGVEEHREILAFKRKYSYYYESVNLKDLWKQYRSLPLKIEEEEVRVQRQKKRLLAWAHNFTKLKKFRQQKQVLEDFFDLIDEEKVEIFHELSSAFQSENQRQIIEKMQSLSLNECFFLFYFKRKEGSLSQIKKLFNLFLVEKVFGCQVIKRYEFLFRYEKITAQIKNKEKLKSIIKLWEDMLQKVKNKQEELIQKGKDYIETVEVLSYIYLSIHRLYKRLKEPENQRKNEILYWKELCEAETLKYRKNRGFLKKKEKIYDKMYYLYSEKEFCQTYSYLNRNDFTYLFLCAEECLRNMESEQAFGYCYRYYYSIFVEYDYPIKLKRRDFWRFLQIIQTVSRFHITKDNLETLSKCLINILVSFSLEKVKKDEQEGVEVNIIQNIDGKMKQHFLQKITKIYEKVNKMLTKLSVS